MLDESSKCDLAAEKKTQDLDQFMDFINHNKGDVSHYTSDKTAFRPFSTFTRMITIPEPVFLDQSPSFLQEPLDIASSPNFIRAFVTVTAKSKLYTENSDKERLKAMEADRLK